jgi:hypothetical protein
MKLSKEEIVLCGLAAAEGDSYTPVQLQKYFFLVDKNLSNQIGGPFFDYQPYDYGVFDSQVYDVAKELGLRGLILIDSNPGTPVRRYSATAIGLKEGSKILSQLHPDYKDYMISLSQWVRSLSFSKLVATMYKLYPETAVNSVFRGNE